jgi:hypothetical protein
MYTKIDAPDPSVFLIICPRESAYVSSILPSTGIVADTCFMRKEEREIDGYPGPKPEDCVDAAHTAGSKVVQNEVDFVYCGA